MVKLEIENNNNNDEKTNNDPSNLFLLTKNQPTYNYCPGISNATFGVMIPA